MAYIYVPDPMPPQTQGPQIPIYVTTPPLPPNTKVTPKVGKGLSYKRAKKISDEWLKVLSEVEEAKKKGKPEDKKRHGLNWVELSLLLIFVSIPIASLELILAVMLGKMLPFK
jgi:hypothetical protein